MITLLASCTQQKEKYKKYEPSKVTVSPIEMNLTLGESQKINLSIEPDYAYDKSIVWTSSNERVAMYIDGSIKSFKSGEAIITATSVNNIVSGCKVIVSEKPIDVSCIIIENDKYLVTVGEEIEIPVTLYPTDAPNRNIKVSISDMSIISEQENSSFKGLKAGLVTITFSSQHTPSIHASCQVQVMADQSFIDSRDGHKYKTIKIGDQLWMAENFAYLPSINTVDDVSSTEAKSYVYGYEGGSVESAKELENYKLFGAFYNYAAALQYCPQGWHLASEEEWQALEKEIGMTAQEIQKMYNRGTAGNRLKSTSTWSSISSEKPDNANNESGFTALASGELWDYYSKRYSYCQLSKTTIFWCQSDKYQRSYTRGLSRSKDFIYRDLTKYETGCSVRYIKD